MLKKPLLRLIASGALLLLLLAAVISLTVAWYTKMVSSMGMEFHVAEWDFSANFAVDDIIVNVFEYQSLNENMAAPGTRGFIPLRLSTELSDTDVNFTITIDRTTMSDEFRARIFFYYLDEENAKVYLGGSPDAPDEDNTFTGIIPREDLGGNGGVANVKLYWEWLYEAPASVTDPLEREAWDEFDTNVGRNPELYAKDMVAKISIVGVQVEPTETTAQP